MIELGCDPKHLGAEISLIAVLHSASRIVPSFASGVLLALTTPRSVNCAAAPALKFRNLLEFMICS